MTHQYHCGWSSRASSPSRSSTNPHLGSERVGRRSSKCFPAANWRCFGGDGSPAGQCTPVSGEKLLPIKIFFSAKKQCQNFNEKTYFRISELVNSPRSKFLSIFERNRSIVFERGFFRSETCFRRCWRSILFLFKYVCTQRNALQSQNSCNCFALVLQAVGFPRRYQSKRLFLKDRVRGDEARLALRDEDVTSVRPSSDSLWPSLTLHH